MADETDESPLKESLTKIQDTVQKAHRFWRTKRAIDRGEPLYDWSASQLAEGKYYGPWKFNTIETFLVGAIAAGAAKLVGLLNKPAENLSQVTAPSDFASFLDPEVVDMLSRTSSWTQPFLAPLLMTSIVFLIAWGSLKRKDSTKVARARARRAYLYLDGARGLYAQLAIATGAGILAGAAVGAELTDVETVSKKIGLSLLFGIVLTAGGLLFQFYLLSRRIPRALFALNGYSTRVCHFWQRSRPDDPPWGKLTFAQFLGGWPLVGGIYVA
jgi:hypothetical protein